MPKQDYRLLSLRAAPNPRFPVRLEHIQFRWKLKVLTSH